MITTATCAKPWLLTSCLVLVAAACAGNPQVKSIDLTQGRGVFLVVFIADPSIRMSAETQLAADLRARGIEAHPSFEDIEPITTSSAGQVQAAAKSRNAAAVAIINPVHRDGEGSAVDDPVRISPLHEDLQAFYDNSRRATPPSSDAREAMVEVDLFTLTQGTAELFWSGTAWSFDGDGAGAAIPRLSEQIADAMAQARSRVLGD